MSDDGHKWTLGPTKGGYKAAILTLLLAYGIAMIWRPLDTCIDVWAHAAVGAWIWDHGTVPHETLYLWTGSIPWVYHHWLTELMFFGLAASPFQQPAILLFTVVVGLAPFALVVWAWEGRESIWIAAPVMVWMMSAMASRIQPRPDLFTSLALTILLLALSRFPGRATRWWLLGFAALFALWANLHGAVVSGLLFLVTTILCDAIQDRDARRTRALCLLFVAALAAVHLNPYGLGYWRAFSSMNSFTFTRLSEWRAVWEAPEPPREMLFGAAVAATLAFVTWALSPRRRLAQLAWLLLAGVVFLKARRNISVLVLVSAVVMAVNAKAIEGQRLWSLLTSWKRGAEPRPAPTYPGWVLRVAVLCFLALELSIFTIGPPRAEPLPQLRDGAAAFLHQHRLQGRALTDMDNSAYFHWQFREDLPLFIDGMNAYPDQLMRDYLTIIGGGRAAHLMIESYDINIIILTVHRIGSVAGLAGNLDQDREWARVYAAGDAVIWVRRRDFASLIEQVGPVNKVSFATLEMWRPGSS